MTKSGEHPKSGGCPSCGSLGVVGDACPERVCSMSGVCRIPLEEAQAALAQGPAKREPLVGHYIGDYLIIGRLGKGGFGKVLLALQRPLFRLRAAVKLIEFEASDDRMRRKILEKFENEAAALAVLNSPNIVRLLQYGLYEDRPYMAMEYIAGSRTLQGEINKLVLDHGALDPATIRRVLEQVLNGLEAAHNEQIIHRDIKPENIMLQEVVGDRWFVKLVDFGLAKVIAESRETSMVLGTVHYMAPEQIEAKGLGAWTDLYAVGAIAFELMIGQRPFPGADSQEILRNKLNPAFDPIAHVADLGIPPVAADFLRKALHRWPEERFRSTEEMRSVLGHVFDSITTDAQFTGDLSRLVDSADMSELRKKEEALAADRKHLEEERRRLAAERRALASERLIMESERLGRPEEVEHAALGGTAVLGGGTQEVTGLPSTGSADPPAPRRRRGGLLMAVAALLVLGGGALAAVTLMSGDGTPSSDAELQVAHVAPEAPSETAEAAVAPDAASPAPDAPAADGPAEVAEAPSAEGATPGATAETVAAVAAVDEAAEAPAPAGEEGAQAEQEEAEQEEAERAEDAPPVPAQILITTAPARAEVLIDGEPSGTTPLLFATHVGAQHRIVASARGRISTSTDVEVMDAVQEVELSLARAPGAGRPTPARPATRPDPAEPAPPALMDF